MSKMLNYKDGVYIYALRQTTDKQIVYVGIAIEPAVRLLEHAYRSSVDIEMLILDKHYDYNMACKAEKRWVVYFAKLNPAMWNGPRIKKDNYGDVDIQVKFNNVRCITVAMAEAVLSYHRIIFGWHMFDYASGFCIDNHHYVFEPRHTVNKIIKSWDKSWHETPRLIESHCNLVFEIMGIYGDFNKCLMTIADKAKIMPSDVFSGAILLVHYATWGLPNRGWQQCDVVKLRKTLSMSLSELYTQWDVLSTSVRSKMPCELADISKKFHQHEEYKGMLDVYRPEKIPVVRSGEYWTFFSPA